MISIVMDGMCSECKYADLELYELCLSYSGVKEWEVRCIHSDCIHNDARNNIRQAIDRMAKMDEVDK